MLNKKTIIFFLMLLPGFVYAQINRETCLIVNEQQQGFANHLHQQWQMEQNKIQTFIHQQKIKQWSCDSAGNISLLYGFSPSGLPEYLTTTYSTLASATVGTNKLWDFGSTGLNLSGNNSLLKSRVALWDAGRPLQTHVELAPRISTGDTGTIGVSSHSTSVAGIMIDKAINADARGMAYGLGGIVSYDFYNDVAEMAVASPNLLLSNHSYITICGWNYRNTSNPAGAPRWEFWGELNTTEDYNFGFYGSMNRNVDSIVFNAPFYTVVKAAGNNRSSNGPAIGDSYWRRDATGNWIMIAQRDSTISSNNGYDILPTLSNAKNIITVGSVYPIANGYTQPSDVQLTGYSSWGPTDDGRIKPDIVAPGENIFTASSASDTSYNLFGGTSAATPVVTGSLVLLEQLAHNLNNKFLRAASLKAVVVHTADEAGPSLGPDYMNGWGLLNVEKAANVIRNQNYNHLLVERTLLQGRDTSFKVIAADNGSLTFTLCWTDPPGIVDLVNYKNNRTPKLVNDLDLTVTDGNTVYLPWTLDANNPSLPAVQKNNSVDNVEKVEIPNAVAGKEYTVTINHKGTLRNGFQDYSFAASGINGVKATAENPLGLTVVPNPATTNCLIRFKPLNNADIIVSLFSIDGRKIKQETIQPILPITNYAINVSALSKGIYIVNIQHAGMNSSVKMEKL